MSKAIIIPSDKTQPVRWADHANNDYRSMTALVFGGNRDGGMFSLSIVGEGDKRISLFYDDEGLFRLDNEKLPDIINLRAMELWAWCDGVVDISDFNVPLVGDYVVVGDADDDGNSTDAPAWVMEYPFSWHQRIIIVEKEGEGDDAE
jgi:hypothetical protein